ncbi:MAG: hypothetical protein HRU10_06605 [Opitutales bacterium]|nr:hypothetical protein [Opitutales bacterium]
MMIKGPLNTYLLISLLLPTLATTVKAQESNLGFYPQLTQPEWTASDRYNNFGGISSSNSENLYDGSGVQVIYPGMEGAFVVQDDSLELGGFSDFPLTRTQQDYSLTSEGVAQFGFRVYSYNANTPTDSTASFFYDENTEEVVLGQRTGNPPIIILPTATIGQVYSYDTVGESITEIEGEALNLTLGENHGFDLSRTTTISNSSVRYVYAGFQTVDNLLLGAEDPSETTDAYVALVRVTEITSNTTTTTELIGGDLQTDPLTIPGEDITSTSVEWLVHGYGAVRFVFTTDGGFLDRILGAPVFDSGDGIVSTTSLEDITGYSYDGTGIPFDIVKESRGVDARAKPRDATDFVDSDGKISILGDYTTSAQPDNWWSRQTDSLGENWFYSPIFDALVRVPVSVSASNQGDGWIYVDPIGYVYSVEQEDGEIWWYIPGQNWVYTTSEAYPYFFSADDNAWLYLQTVDNTAWFFSFDDASWNRL